jgi:ADP-ribose pyrophosphatase YjhB (NUDIX family)
VTPPRFLVRAAVTAFQQLRRGIWFVWRPSVRGVLAVPLTPEGRVVLVRLTYARGWHLPGGGIKRGEEPAAAVLRELREEIGLVAHGEVLWVGEFEHRPDHRRGTSTLFLVQGVRYAPRRSLEIEEIAAFDPAALPSGVTPLTGAKIAEALAPIAG